MGTLLSVAPLAILGFIGSMVVAFLGLKRFVVDPQRKAEERFVEHLRAEKSSELRRHIEEMLEDDKKIDSREWALLSAYLVENGQTWSKRESDRVGPLREVLARIANDAFSREHRLTKEIVSKVMTGAAA